MEDLLKGLGTGAPPRHLLKVFIQDHDDGNRSGTIGEVGFHEVRVLIPGENPKIELGKLLFETCQKREDMHRVPAPILR